MSREEIGFTLFELLPPSMESKDYTSVVADLQSLQAFNEKMLVDHDIKTCKNISEKGSSQIEYVKSKLEAYQKLYTDKDLVARYTCVERDGEIEILTYTELIDSNNCITGSWASKWIAKILTEKSVDLHGEVNFHVHYYERGSNVQSRSKRQFASETVAAREEKVNAMVHLWQKEKMSYEEQLSKVIVDAIAFREKTFYDDLQIMYNECDGGLKKVRRILPVTKTRFKWDTAAQKQVKLLNERKSE